MTRMDRRDMYPGLRVLWRCFPRGGYGYSLFVGAKIVKVGRRRITIDAELRHGGTKRTCVAPSNVYNMRSSVVGHVDHCTGRKP